MDGALGQLVDHLRGRDDRAWAGSVEDLLFDGETIRRTIEFENNRIVLTSHRLLAFTPDSDGENFKRVDLPNVADVRAGHVGESNLIQQGARFLLYGGVLLAVGVFVDFGSFVPTNAFGAGGEASGQLGVGGLLSTMSRFMRLLAEADRYARMIGAVLLLFSTFVFGVYLLTRDRALVIAVAGEREDIHVPASEAGTEKVVAALEAELFGADAGDGNAGKATGQDSDSLADPSSGQ
jgi:hypothetical protein